MNVDGLLVGLLLWVVFVLLLHGLGAWYDKDDD